MPKCTPFGDGVIARKLHQNDNWRFAIIIEEANGVIDDHKFEGV